MSCNGCDLCPRDDVEFTAGDTFVKQMAIPRAFTMIPQHSHAYDHLSMLATGSVSVWKDGVYDRDYTAPEGIFIASNVKHTFQSLVDHTIIYCIHQLRSGAVEIVEEHQFTE